MEFINMVPFERISVFLLILFRISAFLLSAPIFGSAYVPARAKIGLSLALSVILLPIVEKGNFSPPKELLTYGIVVFREVMVGVIIGYSARLVFAGIDFAGQVIGLQMGFGIANIIDPKYETQISVIAQFQGLVAILIFLCINGHHWLLQALAKSFETIPLSGFAVSPLGRPLLFAYSEEAVAILLKMSSDIFVVAFKIGAPVIVALFLTNVTLGVLTKAVPRMNVFFMSFPLTIIIGLLSLAASLQVLGYLLPKLFHQMQNDIATLIGTL
ncbi:MAG: flagellar biosynthetic protein FliR [bacterium]